MTLQKNLAGTPQGTGDEIDEIMNEIEELQQSMSAAQNGSAPAPRAQAAPVPVAAQPASEPSAAEPNVMEEFQGGSGDVSMEETLANLKDDEPSGPNLIDQAMEAEAAAQAEEAESAEVAEVGEIAEVEAMEDPSEELLDDAETEALDEAVAEAEKAAILAAAEAEAAVAEADAAAEALAQEEDLVDEEMEEVPMSEAPRRGRTPSHQPTVSMKLTGDMLLRLSYDFEGQEVVVGFSDGALRVQLSDGTEFKIPVRRNPLRRVA
jgi:hypothetical protein